ncbi:MAG: translation initiation factor IF-2 subunit beta [archaeon]
MSYEDLLKRARENLPEQTAEDNRFEAPTFQSFNQGSQTIIKNFTEVAGTLERDVAHLMKFILGESGAAGDLDGHRLILKGRKTQDFLNQKLEVYINRFLICDQCGKPDTELRKEEGVLRIKCKACGAKYTPKR